MRLFSISRAQDDIDCERAGYYSREWGGTGLSPIEDGWDLVYGNIIHRYLCDQALNGSIDFLAARKQIHLEASKIHSPLAARDWAALAEGQLRGFVSYVWPALMAEYEVFKAEDWITWEVKPGFTFRARRDLLLKSKIDGHIRYVEYKTTSSNRPQWIASWDKAPQLHTGMYVEKVVNGIDIQDAIVVGLYKGYKDEKNSTIKSAFSGGYVNREYSMIPSYSHERKYGKGWEQFSTYDEFPDLQPWVATMTEEKLSEQFPRTAPIFQRQDIAQAWFKQQMYREQEKAEGLELLKTALTVEDVTDLLDRYFRQNFSKCKPPFGYECKFQPLCWIPFVGADPLGSKQFVRYDGSTEKSVEIL